MAEVTETLGVSAGGRVLSQPREAVWRRAPWRGLWLLAISILASVVYLLVLVPNIGISDGDATLNYPTLFFFWAFSFLNLFNSWSLDKVRQPWRGVIAAVACWVLTILSWAWLKTVMDPYAANAMMFYALFGIFLFAWFSDDISTVLPLPKPATGALLVLGSVLLGWLVYSQIGIVPQMWLFFIPMWLLYFMEGWPVTGKGRGLVILYWLVAVMVLTWLFNYFHDLAGYPMSGATGNDLESLLWMGMTPVYVMEMVLLKGKQPLKGILLILLIFALGVISAAVYYFGLHLPEWWASRWIFTLWMWVILFQWLFFPWPSRREASAG